MFSFCIEFHLEFWLHTGHMQSYSTSAHFSVLMVQMTRSLGRLAKVGQLDLATRLRLENDAICMGLPVAPAGSISLKEAGTNDKRIEVTQDGSNSGTFVVRNEGTVYSKSSINPSFQQCNTSSLHPWPLLTAVAGRI